MASINITASLLLWQLYVDLLNEIKVRGDQSRIITNAKTGKQKAQAYSHYPGFITNEVKSYGEWLIKESINSLREFLRTNFISLDEYRKTSGKVPSLFINNDVFIKILGIAPRTVRNHLQQLESPEIGLIIKYKFHRTTCNFEIWLNPAFLLSEWVKSPTQISLSPVFKDPVYSETGTILPLSSVTNTIKKIKNSVIIWL